MCKECGCGQVERFGVHPMQEPPLIRANLVGDGRSPSGDSQRRPLRDSAVWEPLDGHSHPDAPPGPGGAHDEHEHVHDDGTRHSHPHGTIHTHRQASDQPHDEDRPPPVSSPGSRTLHVGQPILARNDRLAERNRGYLRGKRVTAINMLSSPGAGKTALIEKTVGALGLECPVAVIVGDLATANDAGRIRTAGAPVVQITTGTACHLDAEMVGRGLEHLDLDGRRLLIIENVGNLVCPADFDLGEGFRVVLVSVTEGEDKPLKYPPAFRSAQAVLITKLDLVEATGCKLAELRDNIGRIAPQARVIEVSARSGEGLADWLDLLRSISGIRAG